MTRATLRKTLGRLRGQVPTLRPGDGEAIARLGAALEDALQHLPGPDESLTECVGAALEALQSLYLGTASDPAAVVEEVGRLLGDAEQTLRRRPAGARSSAARDPDASSVTQSEPEPQPPLELQPHPELRPECAADEQLTLPVDADRDLLADFVAESRDLIVGAEAALLALESDPDDLEAVNTVFRAFHTIKGTSGFAGITRISELAHRAESLLSRVREREIRCTGGYADLALRSVDVLKELIDGVSRALSGDPGPLAADYVELMRVLLDPESAGVSSQAGTPAAPPPRLGDILVAEGRASREAVEAAAASKGDQPIGVALVRADVAAVADVAKALRTQQRLGTPDAGAEGSVRVRTDRLDRLINLVGELVIAQSMVTQDEIASGGAHPDLSRKVGHAGKIVRELQDLSLSMRMVPLKPTFQKMARLVRDLVHKTGKAVEFAGDGEDTEIDRNMVDVLGDPLIHMVRNAVDHGIEPPEQRERAGKSAAGTVRLTAHHSGGSVVVELRDDGRGLDREKILRKAIERGLIESDRGLSESDVYGLIFEPGFSTAEQITDVSGRGVGMDVVKRSIASLGGRIDIASDPGHGCTFTVRLPLTLAITDGMLVRVGAERYIVPTASIDVTLQPQPGQLSTVHGRGELLTLRGELVPVVRLHRLFGVDTAVQEPSQGLLVVIGERERRCALLVDELLGQQQVVAKPLGSYLGKLDGIAGGAILGDGRVGIILDTAALLTLTRQGQATGLARAA